MRRNKVRQLREAIPLSIAELERRAGLAYQTVTKMERGNTCHDLRNQYHASSWSWFAVARRKFKE